MTIFRDKGLVNVFQCCSRQKQLFFNNCKIAFWENSAPVVWDKGTIKAIAPSMFNKNVFFPLQSYSIGVLKITFLFSLGVPFAFF